jgi:hypothetical protein
MRKRNALYNNLLHALENQKAGILRRLRAASAEYRKASSVARKRRAAVSANRKKRAAQMAAINRAITAQVNSFFGKPKTPKKMGTPMRRRA